MHIGGHGLTGIYISYCGSDHSQHYQKFSGSTWPRQDVGRQRWSEYSGYSVHEPLLTIILGRYHLERWRDDPGLIRSRASGRTNIR